MATTKGNRANVLKRWGTGKWKPKERNDREPFKGTPQFSMDDLYISPFTQKRVFDEAGRKSYVALEQNLTPTGINVLDSYLQALHSGRIEAGTFCARYGAKTHDLDGLLFLLTGMSTQDFRARWIVRCADDLLRYTDLGVVEIARLSAAGSRSNLYFVYERDLNTSPTQRRQALRKDGDLFSYKL